MHCAVALALTSIVYPYELSLIKLIAYISATLLALTNALTVAIWVSALSIRHRDLLHLIPFGLACRIVAYTYILHKPRPFPCAQKPIIIGANHIPKPPE